MAELPFLVVHGAVVWKLLLVGLIGATYAVGYAVRQRGARKRACAELARQDVSSPRKGPVSVRGRIRTGTATTLRQAEASFDTRSTDLTLDCDGELVELLGPVRVEQGATTRGSWRSDAADAPRWNTSLVRSVAPGDEVIASGVLVEGPAEPSSYREAKPTWRLQADDLIRVFATKPRARAMPLGYGQHVALLVLVSSVWFGTLHLVGSRALARAEDQTGTAVDGNLPAFGSAEIAAAMPGSRDDALKAVDSQLTIMGHAKTERALQTQVALRELQGLCSARLLAKAVRLDQALVAARSCDHEIVAKILAFQGRFDEAEHELAPNDHSESATVIHIATGHWAEAALGVDERASNLERETDPANQPYLREAAAATHCLAALLRSYGGDHDAFAKVKDRGNKRLYALPFTACAILEAMSRPVAEQAAALTAIAGSRSDSFSSAGYELDAEELAVAAGAPAPEFHQTTGRSALLFPFTQARVWIAPFQLAAHPNDSTTELAHANMVAVAAFLGDTAAARDHLSYVTEQESHDLLALSLAIRDGSPLVLGERRDHLGNDEAVSLRQGNVDDKIQSYLDGEQGAEFRANVQRAANGDGLGLVAALQEWYLQWQAFSLPVLGVLPRITSHREEVRDALRMFRNELGTYDARHLPFEAVSDYTQYRDAARLIGDTDDAEQWQTIIDRFAVVFRDRQRLVALVFWRE